MTHLFVRVYIKYVQVVHAEALEYLNAYTTCENGIDDENADSGERHCILKLDVITCISQRMHDLKDCCEYNAHGDETQEVHHGHCI